MAAVPEAARAQYRTFLRVGGVVVFGIGLVLTIIGFGSLLSTASSMDFEGPKHFYLVFIGLPLMAVGGWLLQAGFLGAAARYAAGEAAPAIRTVTEAVREGMDRSGPYCSACGVRNDAGARFCDACGKPLATA